MKIRKNSFLYHLSTLLDDTNAGPYDVVQIGVILVLLFLGITSIYSSHSYSGGRQWIVQIVWSVLGLAIYFTVSRIDYSFWDNHAYPIYYIAIALLLLLWSPLGGSRFGATRWIKVFGLVIQPAEPAKLGFIVMLSSLLARMEIDTVLNSIKNLAKCVIVFCIPTLLVFLQPDLGSALTFPTMFFAMLYVSNLSKKFFVCVALSVLLFLTVVVSDIYGYRNFLDKKQLQGTSVEKYENRSILPLKDYQRDRIISFIFPDVVDPSGLGVSWNLRQSLIAVGTGGLFGKGFTNGTQAKLGYLPKSVASNDFVFSVLAEERGFVGALVVLLLYGIIIWGGLRTANYARDRFGTYVCVGISALFLVHVCINIGMTIGLMPITGIPLPFFSYGGSFLSICCFLQGIVQSVHRHQYSFT